MTNALTVTTEGEVTLFTTSASVRAGNCSANDEPDASPETSWGLVTKVGLMQGVAPVGGACRWTGTSKAAARTQASWPRGSRKSTCDSY